eukprot:41455_1
MSNNKRKIEEIFDEHENIPCSTIKSRKIQTHNSHYRDFGITYCCFWTTDMFRQLHCSICKKKCKHAINTLDDIHYLYCYQCFKINAVNEENIDIINSIYGAINNVYNDLLIDENIIHLIANYSMGFIVECCNHDKFNKCQQIISYDSFFQFHFDTKAQKIYHYKITLNNLNVSTQNICGNKVRIFCESCTKNIHLADRKCFTGFWSNYKYLDDYCKICFTPQCNNRESVNYYNNDELMLHKNHPFLCVEHLSQVIQNTNTIRIQIKKCIVKFGIDNTQIIDSICDYVCAYGNIVDCCNEKCNQEIIITDKSSKSITKCFVNRSDFYYNSKAKTVYLYNKEMRIFCRFCSAKSVHKCKKHDCDYYDLERNLFGCVDVDEKNCASCKKHSKLEISFSNEEIKLISNELNININYIMQLIIDDIKQYKNIEMNIENLQNNQLILYIPYLVCKSATRSKKNSIKLSKTCKLIAELSCVKFLKKLTSEGITFIRHFKGGISKEIKVLMFGNKCKTLQIGNECTAAGGVEIGKVMKAWRHPNFKNIPSDCCCGVHNFGLSSVYQNKSEIEQFVKVINECDNRDFMHISNLFQLCLSPLFECL